MNPELHRLLINHFLDKTYTVKHIDYQIVNIYPSHTYYGNQITVVIKLDGYIKPPIIVRIHIFRMLKIFGLNTSEFDYEMVYTLLPF